MEFTQAVLFVYLSLILVALGIVLTNWKPLLARVYLIRPTAPTWLVYVGFAIFILFPVIVLGPLSTQIIKALKK